MLIVLRGRITQDSRFNQVLWLCHSPIMDYYLSMVMLLVSLLPIGLLFVYGYVACTHWATNIFWLYHFSPSDYYVHMVVSLVRTGLLTFFGCITFPHRITIYIWLCR